MSKRPPHRKRIRHYHRIGDCHELTFSCYGRRPLLTNDHWRELLSRSIDRATSRHDFRLLSFVFMPEHVHLLVHPNSSDARVDGLLKAIKQPFSYRVKRLLIESDSPLLGELTVQERPGKQAFRFWQEGAGYDRNLHLPKAIQASITYIHLNPVRRGLTNSATQWRWSSALHYETDDVVEDSVLPRIDPVPWQLVED